MVKFLRSKKFDLLKKYFTKESSVLLAFLFGSRARGMEMEESDLDVGVYLEDKENRDKIWGKITDIAGEEVDLVCLNDAPATLISNIFKTGVPLVVKDKKLYWELYLKMSLEAEDFLAFVEDFWRIKRKAKSLGKEEKVRLMKRIDYLESEMEELERFKKMTGEEYFRDRDKRRVIERWAENIINAIIDIAKIVLASEKKVMPESYKRALFDFALLVGFDLKKSEKFSRLAELRNVLAHEYLNILYEKLQNFIKEFPRFYKKISKFLERYLELEREGKNGTKN